MNTNRKKNSAEKTNAHISLLSLLSLFFSERTYYVAVVSSPLSTKSPTFFFLFAYTTIVELLEQAFRNTVFLLLNVKKSKHTHTPVGKGRNWKEAEVILTTLRSSF